MFLQQQMYVVSYVWRQTTKLLIILLEHLYIIVSTIFMMYQLISILYIFHDVPTTLYQFISNEMINFAFV